MAPKKMPRVFANIKKYSAQTNCGSNNIGNKKNPTSEFQVFRDMMTANKRQLTRVHKAHDSALPLLPKSVTNP